MSLSVPDICDQFPDEIDVLDPIFTNYGGKQRFSGEIVTIRCFEDNSLVGEAVRTEGKGRVIAVDGGGSMRFALLGDLLAEKARENGWQGLVINGCVRDVEILRDIDVGIKALACFPVKTEKRGEGQRDVGVSFAGVRIEPGQYLYADANGIVVAERDLGVEF
ncbi:MAG: ribonuclease E activity regulator RraA [Lysobacterales bacterium]|jgi:regulator of ribonuclease activity A